MEAIAREISRRDGSLVLDVACGYGYYTMKLSSNNPSGTVIAVDVVSSAFTNMRKLLSRPGPHVNIEPLMADSCLLPLRNDVFDIATSFLGMRDIYMTRGKRGVESTMGEMIRSSKNNGRIALTVTLPDLAMAKAVRVAIDMEREVFGTKSLPFTFYTGLLKENSVGPIEKKTYSTGLMNTAGQTKVELGEGIEIA
jgi:ubiquinone/menaquinone biosynthesis C-methylase UbiE